MLRTLHAEDDVRAGRRLDGSEATLDDGPAAQLHGLRSFIKLALRALRRRETRAVSRQASRQASRQLRSRRREGSRGGSGSPAGLGGLDGVGDVAGDAAVALQMEALAELPGKMDLLRYAADHAAGTQGPASPDLLAAVTADLLAPPASMGGIASLVGRAGPAAAGEAITRQTAPAVAALLQELLVAVGEAGGGKALPAELQVILLDCDNNALAFEDTHGF
jgi:hypothetical protein